MNTFNHKAIETLKKELLHQFEAQLEEIVITLLRHNESLQESIEAKIETTINTSIKKALKEARAEFLAAQANV